MTPNDPVPEFGLSWRMRDHEARLLADSLRTSRLTLLYAGAGASRSDLLRCGVVPLVARRETDLRPDGALESRVVEPFVDRRGAAGGGFGPTERAVFFNAWDGEPLGALLAAVRAAFPGVSGGTDRELGLADLLQTLSERSGARLLVVLDAGERLWAAGNEPAATARFIDAFGEAVNRRRLPANFLLAVDDRYEGQTESLRRVVPRFDDATVRLLGFDDVAAPSPSRAETPALHAPSEFAAAAPPIRVVSEPPTLSDAISPTPPAARPRRKRPPKVPRAPSVPIQTDGVYAFIESTLTQTADASEPWHEASAVPATVAVPSPTRRGARAGVPTRPAAGAPDRGRSASPDAMSADIAHLPVAARVEPPSPIDEWLDAALAWCRRMLRAR